MITVAEYRNLASEHSMQSALIERLHQRARVPLLAFAIPNAAKRSPRTAAQLKREGMLAGVADLCIMLEGGFVIWMELKTRKGRVRAGQKAFRASCDMLGHPYLMPRTLDDAICMLTNRGILLP